MKIPIKLFLKAPKFYILLFIFASIIISFLDISGIILLGIVFSSVIYILRHLAVVRQSFVDIVFSFVFCVSTKMRRLAVAFFS